MDANNFEMCDKGWQLYGLWIAQIDAGREGTPERAEFQRHRRECETCTNPKDEM